MKKGKKMADHHNRPADAQAPARYNGKTIDANRLKAGGEWKDQQSIIDALYITCKVGTQLLGYLVPNDAPQMGGQNPRIPNVVDNSFAQSIGGYSYLTEPYGLAQHPPSDDVRAAVDEVLAWGEANLHQGGKHGEPPKHRK